MPCHTHSGQLTAAEFCVLSAGRPGQGRAVPCATRPTWPQADGLPCWQPGTPWSPHAWVPRAVPVGHAPVRAAVQAGAWRPGGTPYQSSPYYTTSVRAKWSTSSLIAPPAVAQALRRGGPRDPCTSERAVLTTLQLFHKNKMLVQAGLWRNFWHYVLHRPRKAGAGGSLAVLFCRQHFPAPAASSHYTVYGGSAAAPNAAWCRAWPSPRRRARQPSPPCCLHSRLLPAQPPAACTAACCLHSRLLPAQPPAACTAACCLHSRPRRPRSPPARPASPDWPTTACTTAHTGRARRTARAEQTTLPNCCCDAATTGAFDASALQCCCGVCRGRGVTCGFRHGRSLRPPHSGTCGNEGGWGKGQWGQVVCGATTSIRLAT